MGRLVKRWGRVVPAEILDAGVAARALLEDAHGQAERLVAAARDAAAAIRTQARDSGRAEAEAAFTTMLVAARADAERVRAAALPTARGLATRMAEKILGRALALEPAVAADIAAQALGAAQVRAGLVKLRIHPADRAAIEAARPLLGARLAAAVELRVVDDPTVTRGGCVVDTPVGRLDARLETQLAALERAIFEQPEAAEAERREQPAVQQAESGARRV